MICIGVDPGERYTGIVVRSSSATNPLAARVLDRKLLLDPLTDLDPVRRRKAWAALVRTSVAAAIDDLRSLARRGLVFVAVENVVAPHPRGGQAHGGKARVIAPAPIIETAVVMSAVMDRFDAVLVNPADHGGGPASAYPDQLNHTTAALGGPHKHARSAWDVAGQGLLLNRITAPTTSKGDDR